MAGTGFHSVVANRAQMCTADHSGPLKNKKNRTGDYHKGYNFTADCHSQESKFENRLPRGYSCCGKPQYTGEQFAKGLFL
jgi:hypothetical protein